MKKETIISIGLIALGFVFEYLYLGTDTMFFIIKFWLLGVICILSGFIGLWWFTVLPLLENRAETLGKFKRKSMSKDRRNKKAS